MNGLDHDHVAERRSLWIPVVGGGLLWASVYNLVWGVGWFTLMRREWLDAVAAIDGSLPWTPRFWIVWAVLTLPFGMAIVAYLRGRAPSTAALKAALAASLVVWIPMTLAMAVWGWQAPLPMRLVVTDSGVNLIAVVAATLAGLRVTVAQSAERAVKSPPD